MSDQAKGTFILDSWDDTPFDEADGATLSLVRVLKTFSGDIDGTSVAELLTASANEQSRAYVAVERVTGSVHELAGTFVLVHHADSGRAGDSLSISVLPESATENLAGMTGDLDITIDADGTHGYTLTYEMGSQE